MTLEPPKIKRTHVTLTDPETRKSRGFTLYGATMDEAHDRIRGAIADNTPGDDKPTRPARRISARERAAA